VKIRYLQRCKLLKLRFKREKRWKKEMEKDAEEMKMEEKVLRSINKDPWEATPAMLARRLKTDVRTIQRSINNLQSAGKLRPFTDEKLLQMGK
jgi:predicted HTH transcriptional regulator